MQFNLYSKTIPLKTKVDRTVQVGSYTFGYRCYDGLDIIPDAEILYFGPFTLKLTATTKAILGTLFLLIISLITYFFYHRRKRKLKNQLAIEENK